MVELFGTVTGATTQGVVAEALFVAAALLVDVALLVATVELGFVVVPVAVVPLAEVAEPGTVPAEADMALFADGAGIMPCGQGLAVVFVVVVVLVPGADVAPAGMLLFGFVAEVAPAGVLPGFVVFIVPFC